MSSQPHSLSRPIGYMLARWQQKWWVFSGRSGNALGPLHSRDPSRRVRSCGSVDGRLHARCHSGPGARPRSSPGIRPSPEPGDPGRRADLLLGHGGDQPGDRRARARHGDQRGAAHLRKSETASGVGGLVAGPHRASARDDLRPHRVRRAEPRLPAICPERAAGPHRHERADRGRVQGHARRNRRGGKASRLRK